MDVSYRGTALASEIHLAPGLGHRRASGIRKNHRLEMLYRAGPVAVAAQCPRPLEFGFCRLRRRRVVLHDAVPERDGGGVVMPRRIDARRRVEQKRAGVWHERQDRYSELRAALAPGADKVEMYYIGG